MWGSIEIKLQAETDFRVSTQRRIRSISRFFSNILYRVPDTTFDRWLNAKSQRDRVKGCVFEYDARVSREFADRSNFYVITRIRVDTRIALL